MRLITVHVALIFSSLYFFDRGLAFPEVDDESYNADESNTTPSMILRGGRRNLSSTGRPHRRLEFVHITKTGGSAVEKAAASVGVLWGVCHFMYIPRLGCVRPDMKSRRPTTVRYKDIPEPWHVPLQYHVDLSFLINASTFTIVRNPYDRIVSEYYCPYGGVGKDDTDWERPDKMNEFVRDRIPRAVSKENTLHFLPQHHYVYHEGKRYVDHILHYETLSQEFPKLMTYYGLDNIILPKKPEGGNRKKLTAKDLDRSTLNLINEIYREDFLLFNYEMM